MMRIVCSSKTLCLLACLPTAVKAGTVEEWLDGRRNECRNQDDTFINFEGGIDGQQIQSTIPGVSFTNTNGLDWLYGDTRTGQYNANGFNGDFYNLNGNIFAWLGVSGNRGRIDFAGKPPTYFSALVSVGPAGLTFQAYDAAGNLVDSATATENLNPRTPQILTRLTVENPGGISHVEVFDSGNFWLIDDICTDAGSPCRPLPNRSRGPSGRRIDVVFLKDTGYANSDADFLAAVNSQIDNRLLAINPVAGNANAFNFYISDTLEGNSQETGTRCGEGTLPTDFRTLCPFADVVAVVHSETYGDCSSNRVFSTEDDIVRSFIHEAGHGVFGVYDEYDDAASRNCSTYRPTTNYNIYQDEAACDSDVMANGLNLSCIEFTTCGGGLWKPDDGAQNIMDDGKFFMNGWSPSSTWRITEVLTNVVAGLPPPAGGLEPADPTKSFVTEVMFEASALTLVNTGFVVSAPPSCLDSVEAEVVITILDASGNILATCGVANPRVIAAESDYEGESLLPSESAVLVLPLFPDATHITIDDIAISGATLDIPVDIGSIIPAQPDPPTAVCAAVTTTNDPGLCSADVSIDGGSFDPEGRPFDVISSPMGPYPIGTTSVSLSVTNIDEWTSTCSASVIVTDTEDPTIDAPLNLTLACTDTIPAAPLAEDVARDNCGIESAVFSETKSEECPETFVVERTWSVIDPSGNTASGTQSISVQDTTAPTISCNVRNISPSETSQTRPVVFVPTAVDDCASNPTVEVVSYDCWKTNKKGKRIGVNCQIDLDGDAASVYITGGVGSIILLAVQATDNCGNLATQDCLVEVVN